MWKWGGYFYACKNTLDTAQFRCYNKSIRGISAVGSASHSHCEGQGFDSPMLHQNNITQTLLLCRWLCHYGLAVISKRKNQKILCSLVLWNISHIRKSSKALHYKIILFLL